MAIFNKKRLTEIGILALAVLALEFVWVKWLSPIINMGSVIDASRFASIKKIGLCENE